MQHLGLPVAVGGTWRWQCGTRVCVARFEVLTAVLQQICILRDVALCRWVCSSCSVEGLYCLYCFHFQLLVLKMKAVWCSEMMRTAHPTYSLGSSHVACLGPLSGSLLFVLISAVSRTRWGLLMRQQFITFSSEQLYPCVKSLPVTELHCYPKLQYMASSLLPASGLIVRILCQI